MSAGASRGARLGLGVRLGLAILLGVLLFGGLYALMRDPAGPRSEGAGPAQASRPPAARGASQLVESRSGPPAVSDPSRAGSSEDGPAVASERESVQEVRGEGFELLVELSGAGGEAQLARRVTVRHQSLAELVGLRELATTDEVTAVGGSARFFLPFGRRITSVRVWPTETSPGVVERCWLATLAEPGEARIEVELPAPRGLRGSVVDPSGAVAPGALVEVWMVADPNFDEAPDRIAIADERGRFSIRGLASGARLAASRGEQRTPGRLTLDFSNERLERPIAIQLREPVPVFGRVTDGQAPLEGVRVTVQPGFEKRPEGQWLGLRREVETGTDGVFELARFSASQARLTASKAGYEEESRRLGKPSGSIRLELKRGPELQLVVVDELGQPVPGAKGHLETRIGSTGTAEGDAFGRLELPITLGGGSILVVRAEGWAEHRERFSHFGGGGRELLVRLTRPVELAGRVVDADGRGLPSLRVELRREQATAGELLGLGAQSAIVGSAELTDADGGFRWESLEAGSKSLRVLNPERPERVQQFLVTPSQSPIEIVFDPERAFPVLLGGRAVDASTGGPLEGVTVLLGAHPEDGGAKFESPVTTNELGRFDFEGQPLGRYSLWARRDGYVDAFAPPRPLGPGASTLQLELWPERDLVVRVVDAEGRPVEEALVGAFDESGEPLPLASSASFLPTSPEFWFFVQGGTAKIEGLPAGPIRLHARRLDQMPGPGVELAPGFVEGQQIELVAPDAGGPPTVYVNVRLFDGSRSEPGLTPKEQAESLRRAGSEFALVCAELSAFDAEGELLGKFARERTPEGVLRQIQSGGALGGVHIFGETGFAVEFDPRTTRVRITAPGFAARDFDVNGSGLALPDSIVMTPE